MDVRASVETAAPAPELFGWVDDLARYPEWLGIVPRAVPVPSEPGEEGPAWSVDLRGSLGPLARSKRLRMVRTEHDAPTRVVFERREVGERRGSPWVLTAVVDALPAGSRLEMHLHYGGRMWARPLEALLADEIERSRRRLVELVGT